MKKSTDFYKAAAYRASEFLLHKRKLKMKHSEALELIAAIFNQPNWQTLHAIGQNEIDLHLSEFNLNDKNLKYKAATESEYILPLPRPDSPWINNAAFRDSQGNIVPYQPNILQDEPEEILTILYELEQMFDVEHYNKERYVVKKFDDLQEFDRANFDYEAYIDNINKENKKDFNTIRKHMKAIEDRLQNTLNSKQVKDLKRKEKN